jgi:hypothetical protein
MSPMVPATGCRYEDLGAAASGGRRRSRLAVDAHLFGEHDVLDARTDLLDVQVQLMGRARLGVFLPVGEALGQKVTSV